MSTHAQGMKSKCCENELGELSRFEQLRIATDVIRAEADALSRLSTRIPDDFCEAVSLIRQCPGVVIVTGVGKAGWIGQKVSASLASTGTRSHFLHPAEAIHGDLGRVSPNDVVLVFSNSGETNEIIKLLPTFAKMENPIIAITSKLKSTLTRYSSQVLDYGPTREACHLELAPTTSTTLMLALGDALAMTVSRLNQLRPTDFAKNHPGGSLGKQLSIVDEAMRPVEHCRVANEAESVREIYVRHSSHQRRSGVILITNNDSVLTGIFTDSDLARLLACQQDELFDRAIGTVMTRSPITIASGSKTVVAIETLACRNLSELPVVNNLGQVIGLIDITDVVNSSP
ncbi:MAG: KpsF/GutQ family sugar-phosphate isomerase [Mariniblastus sp.]|nr:KpsF/GutQ family sugar-phosphate isomerase [Mariniblastus sp.]